MKIEEISPAIRFADRFEYTCARPLSKTYDSRLLYITSGSGSITVDGKSAAAERGLLVLFQGGVPYKFEPSPAFVAFAVDFDLSAGYECGGFLLPCPTALFDEQRLHARAAFEDSDFLSAPFMAEVNAGIGEDIRRLTEEYNSGKLFSKKRAELMLGGVLLELARRAAQRTKGARCAERAVAYIGEHYRESVSNEDIAAALGHEACYLNRTVKLYTGSSIHRLLNKKRVEEGVKLLLATDLSVDEIAERVGFCSASHFSKRCKDILGNSPSFYRKY